MNTEGIPHLFTCDSQDYEALLEPSGDFSRLTILMAYIDLRTNQAQEAMDLLCERVRQSGHRGLPVTLWRKDNPTPITCVATSLPRVSCHAQADIGLDEFFYVDDGILYRSTRKDQENTPVRIGVWREILKNVDSFDCVCFGCGKAISAAVCNALQWECMNGAVEFSGFGN